MVTLSLPAEDEEQVVRIVLVADHGLASLELPDPNMPLDRAQLGALQATEQVDGRKWLTACDVHW